MLTRPAQFRPPVELQPLEIILMLLNDAPLVCTLHSAWIKSAQCKECLQSGLPCGKTAWTAPNTAIKEASKSFTLKNNNNNK